MRWLLLLLALFAAPAAARGPLVLAAASLQEALSEAAVRWERKGHARPVLSFAASSALARQVQAGGRADLFISADEAWMDAVAAQVVPGSRANLVGNRLVIVESSSKPKPTVMTRRTLAQTLGRGALAMADPDAVPAGRYGRAALIRLGAWPAVAPRVVRAENVRAALALVERGAAPYGIVYRTDAQSSTKVRIAAEIPTWSHPPIRYPVARLRASRHGQAEGFRRFLLGADGQAVFARHGFTRP